MDIRYKYLAEEEMDASSHPPASYYNGGGQEPLMESEEMVEGEVPASELLISSMAHMSNPAKHSARRRWNWLRYLAWIIPIAMSTVMGITQFFMGVVNVASGDPLARYNTAAGVLGLAIVALQVWDNWYYIRPISWIREEEQEERDQSTWVKRWGVFLLQSAMDTAMFGLNVWASVWALHIYTSSEYYNAVMLMFSVVNLGYQWSKLGFVVFVLKYVFNARNLRMVM